SASSVSFFFHSPRAHLDLHSFPTRRSSDLRRMGSPEIDRRRIGVAHRAENCIAERARVSLVMGSPSPDGRGGQGVRTTSARTCQDRKSTRLNSSHVSISYAVFCLKKKKKD